jgi:hypothetical protein
VGSDLPPAFGAGLAVDKERHITLAVDGAVTHDAGAGGIVEIEDGVAAVAFFIERAAKLSGAVVIVAGIARGIDGVELDFTGQRAYSSAGGELGGKGGAKQTE